MRQVDALVFLSAPSGYPVTLLLVGSWHPANILDPVYEIPQGKNPNMTEMASILNNAGSVNKPPI